MTEISRIARFLQQAVDGKPYYGSSIIAALTNVEAEAARTKPAGGGHSIWELVSHVTEELRYAHAMIERRAGPWIEGETTWPAIGESSEGAWRRALDDLADAGKQLVDAVSRLDAAVLDEKAQPIDVTFYKALHGTVHHTVYHAGQIALLRRQLIHVA